jgi:phosphoribosylformimino-5-aminoimidazole carboxamide ribotide isomerase
MIIYPAIDIRGGKCVRLTEGRFDQETVFANNPAEMAKRWETEGAEFLHLVDLDGALAGRPVNIEVIREIIKTVAIPVQLGGGIRSLQAIEEMLDAGVHRVILGSIAVKQPELVKTACESYGSRIVVGIDARNGEVAVEGWGVSGNMTAQDLAVQMAAAGVQRIVYTDISRDGMLTGINVEETRNLARQAGIPVIASGGVAGLEDITALMRAASAGIDGVIIGKALYTGAVTLPEALRAARGGD